MASRKTRFPLVVFAWVIASAILPSLTAEIIQMKDGRTLRGRILSEDKEAISFQAEDGDYLLTKDQIYRVLMDDPAVLRKQEQEEKLREQQARPVNTQTQQQPQAQLDPNVKRSDRAKEDERKQKEELEHHTGLFIGLSGGRVKKESAIRKIIEDDKYKEYYQQTLEPLTSVSYPYEFSESSGRAYNAYVYYNAPQFFVGAEGGTSRASAGYQMLETITQSGQFFSGTGEIRRIEDQTYRARAGFLAGSPAWSIQPFVFGGFRYLDVKSQGTQTEIITTAATLAQNIYYSSNLAYAAHTQGFEGGLELRFLLPADFELKTTGSYSQLHGGLSFDELRIPLSGALPSTTNQKSKLHIDSIEYTAAIYVPIVSAFRIFFQYGREKNKWKIAETGSLRLPDNILTPTAYAYSDFFRFLGSSVEESSSTISAGVEFHL